MDGTTLLLRTSDQVLVIGDTMAELNRQWAQLATCRDTISALQREVADLRFEQIDGSDARLSDFWEKAQKLADDANHCEVFDQIAEALGGPRRYRDYEVRVTFMVTLPVTYTVSVQATDDDEAISEAEEIINDMDTSEFEDYASWYDAEVDGYGMSSEIC
jgi:hypothetical protein